MYAELSLNKLKVCAEELEQCERKSKRALRETYDCRKGLRGKKDASMEEILWRLRKRQEELEDTIHSIDTLATELFQIIQLYERCEKKIADLGKYCVKAGKE